MTAMIRMVTYLGLTYLRQLLTVPEPETNLVTQKKKKKEKNKEQ